MEERDHFRCMRCGHEYQAVNRKEGELVERTCPRCRSNSIRRLPAETRTAEEPNA